MEGRGGSHGAFDLKIEFALQIYYKKMIQLLTKVNIIDNSGGSIGRCIKILKPHGRDFAKIGDIILVSVIETAKQVGSQFSSTQPSKGGEAKIKKGTMFKALVVRTKTNVVRNTASFDTNAVILLKSSGASSHRKVKLTELPPIGTRIKGPISVILTGTTDPSTKITSLSSHLV